MLEIYQTRVFTLWLDRLADKRGQAAIQMRIDRLALGNPGDVEPVGQGVSEMRVHSGPGYRVYFVKRGLAIVVLLCGGGKKTQRADIRSAKDLAATLGDIG